MERQRQDNNFITEPRLQNEFLLNVKSCETNIKKIILDGTISGYSKNRILDFAFSELDKLKSLIEKIDFPNKQDYIKSLERYIIYLVNNYSQKAQMVFLIFFSLMVYEINKFKNDYLLDVNIRDVLSPYIKSNRDIIDFLNGKIKIVNRDREITKIINKFLKSKPKEMETYELELDKIIINLADDNLAVYSELGKKPLGLYQKTEIDIRQEKQEKMLEELRQQNIDLVWTSAHESASKRCAPYQGKLCSLNRHADNEDFTLNEKVDNYIVYSLLDIMNVIDAYGYKNNIINGFNCRHFLIPYVKGSKPPRKIKKEIIEKERAENRKMRYYEERARHFDTLSILYGGLDNRKSKDMALKSEYYRIICQKLAKINDMPYYEDRTKARKEK